MKQSCYRTFTKGNEPVGDFIWTSSNPFGIVKQACLCPHLIGDFNFQFSTFN